MAKAVYVGVGNKAHSVKSIYVGVDGKARKVQKIYVGVDNKARLVYEGIEKITSASGRIFWRHPSNMGTVMEFDDGSPRKVLVLDAKYRLASALMTSSTVQGAGDLPYYSNFGLISNSTITDAQINASNSNIPNDTNTSRHNTDQWLTKSNPTAANHCRSIVVDGVGCDIPNIETLARMYYDRSTIDSMDPTVSDYPNLRLTSWGYGNNGREVYSSTQGKYYSTGYGTCLVLGFNSVIISDNRPYKDKAAIYPVLEL